MLDAIFNLISKIVTDVTMPTSVTLTNATTKVKPAINGGDYPCKIIEVRNTSSTMSVRVYIEGFDDYFTLIPYERRIVMVKKLSDIRLVLDSGSTSTRVEIVIEP